MSGQPAQTKTIRSQLLADMKDGAYASCERLPRESILAEKLGISRTQLRDILASLEREGFITRRHGVGTIINRHVLNVQTRMDIEVEFLDMIRQSGHEPAVAFVRVSDGTADAQVAAQLRIPEDTPIIRIARLCTADGRPAIYCEDVVEKALAKGDYTIQDFKLPIFHFLQRFCGIYPYLDLTDVRPAAADAALAEIFQVPMGTPLLNMEEVDYDIDGPCSAPASILWTASSATPSCGKNSEPQKGALAMKKVAVIMGSDSDWPVVKGACTQLDALDIPYEAHILSAHRTPTQAAEFAKSARERGFGVVICAAGMAAHLAGAFAANTTLPVIGIPMKGGVLDGLDALLATVQMPGGIPVATVALNGAKNAAVLAAQILAVEDEALTRRLEAERRKMAEQIAEKDAKLQEELLKS